MNKTPNYNLNKPQYDEPADIVALNENADLIDAALWGKVDKEAGKGLSAEDYTVVEKTKLAGIEAGANNYTHPATHPASIIAQDENNRFVSDVEKAVWNSPITADKIADGAVNNDAMATNSVRTENIINGSVTLEKLGLDVTPVSLGCETPAGAQNKATVAENNAKGFAEDLMDAHYSSNAGLNRHTRYGVAAGTDDYTVEFGDISSAMPEGISFKIKFPNTNTGAVTLSVNGGGDLPVVKSDGGTLAAGDIKAGQIVHLVYTGSVFQLLGEGGGASPDVWIPIDTSLGTSLLTSVAYGGGVFVIGGSNATLAYSLDGEHWTAIDDIALENAYTQITCIVYGEDYGFVLFTETGFGTSPDGINWYYDDAGKPSNGLVQGAAYGKGLYVIGDSLGNIYTSPDGYSVWNQRASLGANKAIGKITYGKGLFVAVGAGGLITTSPDGIVWTERDDAQASSDMGYTMVGYGNGLFIAGGEERGAQYMLTSPDGIVWTLRDVGLGVAISGFRGFAYGGGLYVTGYNTNSYILTSTDGVTWTPGVGFGGVRAISYGRGLFVAVGYNGQVSMLPVQWHFE